MKFLIFPIILLLFTNCGTTTLIDQWKSPEVTSYSPTKILLVGMTSNHDVRRNYETVLRNAFEKEGIIAVRSVDFFESNFKSKQLNPVELDALEKELLQKGFDVVFITQLMSKEERVTYVESHPIPYEHTSFKDYLLHHESVYKNKERTTYTIYHTQSSYYCLCPEKSKELIWMGKIDLIGPGARERMINSFTKQLLKTLKSEKLLARN